jgi:hypothetical protein
VADLLKQGGFCFVGLGCGLERLKGRLGHRTIGDSIGFNRAALGMLLRLWLARCRFGHAQRIAKGWPKVFVTLAL